MDPDLIPNILRKHPTVRRATVVEVVLKRMRDGTYYVSPVRQSNVSLASAGSSNANHTHHTGQKRAATTAAVTDRFEEEMLILNVLPEKSVGIDLNNYFAFKWQTIGQCENCFKCRSNHRTVLNLEMYYLSPAMRALVQRVVELEQNAHVVMYPLIVGYKAFDGKQ